MEILTRFLLNFVEELNGVDACFSWEILTMEILSLGQIS